jgi:hypothetical protein
VRRDGHPRIEAVLLDSHGDHSEAASQNAEERTPDIIIPGYSLLDETFLRPYSFLM